MTDFVITTYGGGEAIYQAFNAIAALTDLTDKGFGVAVMRVMGVLGLVYALAIVYFRTSLAVAGQWFGWYLLCSMLLFAPGPSLWIKDMVSFSEAPRKVDGVPLVLGFVAGGLSEFMSGAAKSIENVMRVGGPDNHYLTYHRTGYLFASRMMARAKNFKIVTPEFSDNMDSFVQQCVTFQAMIGQQYTKKELQESENVWALVRDNAHKMFGFQYVSRDFTGFVTCEEGARRLDGLWNDEYQKAATYYGRQFFSNTQGDVARTQFMKYLPGSYQALKGVAIHESRILQQEMMSNALEEAPRKKAAQLTGRNYALAKATLGQQNFLSTTGEMAGNLLPYLMTVFQCIIYGSFIIIFIIAPLPGGWMKVLSYSKEILWISSWPILYTIINMVMTTWGRYGTEVAMAGSHLTWGNSGSLSEIHTTLEGYAGWMLLSVPVLSRVIITGSLEGMLHLGNTMISSFEGSSRQAAEERTSGTFRLGEVVENNFQQQNESSFQTNRSASYDSGLFRQTDASGFSLTHTTDGPIGQALLNQLGVNFTIGEGVSTNLGEESTKNFSAAETEALSATESIMSASDEVAQKIKGLSKNTSSGKRYNIDEASSENKTISDVLDLGSEFKKSFGMNDHQALQFAVAASGKDGLGLIVKGLGLVPQGKLPVAIATKLPLLDKALKALPGDVSANYSGSASKDVSMNDVVSTAHKKGHSVAYSDIINAVKSEDYQMSDSERDAFEKNTSEKFSEAKTQATSFGATYQSALSLNQGAKYAKTHSGQFTIDAMPQLIAFAAKHHMPFMTEPMGSEQAGRLFKPNSGMFQEVGKPIIEAFQRETINNTVENFKANMASSRDIKQAFSLGKETVATKVSPDPLKMNEFEREEKKRFTTPSNTAKLDVDHYQKEIQARREQGQDEARQAHAKQQKEMKEAEKRSLITRAVKNATPGWGSVGNTNDTKD